MALDYSALLPGEKVTHLSGWKKRHRKAKERREKMNSPERLAMRRARAKVKAGGQKDFPDQTKVEKPAPKQEAKAEKVEDALTALTDEDLNAYYVELFNEKPHHFKKRETIEGEIREALA